MRYICGKGRSPTTTKQCKYRWIVGGLEGFVVRLLFADAGNPVLLLEFAQKVTIATEVLDTIAMQDQALSSPSASECLLVLHLTVAGTMSFVLAF